MSRALFVTLLLAAVVTTPAIAQVGADAHPRPPAPRFIDVWFGGPLDSIYNAEYQRLQSACSGQDDACYRAELDTTAVRLAPVWPAADDDPVGWLAARLGTHGRWPHATLLFQASGGRSVVLVDDLGDWGYGTTLAVRDARGRRVRPWILEPHGDYWLDRSVSGPGFGIVDGPYGLEHRLWRFGPVTATRDAPAAGSEPATADIDLPPDIDLPAEVDLPAGVYKVLEVTGDSVRFRAEVPGDMACEPVDSASADDPPPTYAMPLQAVLDADGRPSVRVAYPKGC